MVKLGGLSEHADSLTLVDNLILAACGSSYLACKYAENLMRELGCFTYVEAKIASEICRDDLANLKPLGGNGGFLSVS